MRQHSERIAQEKEATCRGFAGMPASNNHD
jgi:hypothetical protein